MGRGSRERELIKRCCSQSSKLHGQPILEEKTAEDKKDTSEIISSLQGKIEALEAAVANAKPAEKGETGAAGRDGRNCFPIEDDVLDNKINRRFAVLRTGNQTIINDFCKAHGLIIPTWKPTQIENDNQDLRELAAIVFVEVVAFGVKKFIESNFVFLTIVVEGHWRHAIATGVLVTNVFAKYAAYKYTRNRINFGRYVTAARTIRSRGKEIIDVFKNALNPYFLYMWANESMHKNYYEKEKEKTDEDENIEYELFERV
jgi:hypothetical protein